MTEREGFEDWYKTTYLEDEVHPTDEYLYLVWQKACEWQRKVDADLCLAVGEDGLGAPGEIWAERCAKSVVEQKVVVF